MTLKRLEPLLQQFDFGIEQLSSRLTGMSDAEYLHEPVPGCWSVRRRSDAVSGTPLGNGEWVLDFGRPEPDPPPFTTIAWRLTHLTSTLTARANYTTGTHSMQPNDLHVPYTAADAVGTLEQSAAAWRNAITSAGEAELDQVGYSKLPWGLDPQMPFIDIVWWMNKEVLHHGAEIAVLRDLYRAHTERSV